MPPSPQLQRLRRRLLRRGLADLGLSYTQAAHLLGYAPHTLWDVQRGSIPFSDSLAFRLEAAFGLPFLALEEPPALTLTTQQATQLLVDVLSWS